MSRGGSDTANLGIITTDSGCWGFRKIINLLLQDVIFDQFNSKDEQSNDFY